MRSVTLEPLTSTTGPMAIFSFMIAASSSIPVSEPRGWRRGLSSTMAQESVDGAVNYDIAALMRSIAMDELRAPLMLPDRVGQSSSIDGSLEMS